MKKRIFSVLLLCFAFLLPFVSIGFSSWVSLNTEASKSFGLDTTPSRVVCYNASTNVNYVSLNSALDNAAENQEIVVYIGAAITCDQDIKIGKNITLTIPFVGKAFDVSKKGGNISDSPLYTIPDTSSRNSYGNKLGDSDASTVQTYRSCLLQMRNGADIINYGKLNLGGACSTEGNNGYYSEINLGLASSIQCKSGSTFQCFGYVKENYEDYSNPSNQASEVYDNSLDAERYIEIESGAKMVTAFAMYDAPSAGNLTTLMTAKQCPFWEWDFPNLQTYTKIDSGSSVSAVALLVGPSNMAISKEVNLFSSNTSSQSMFYLTSGYVGIEYVTKEPLFSSREFNVRRTNLLLSGKTSVGYIYAKEGSGGISMELDTRNSFIPVSCRTKIIIGNGATLVTDKKIKFLAGSELFVEANGKFEVNNAIIFHKKDSISYDKNSGIYYRSTADSVVDALFVCNGTATFNTDGNKNGAIGALIKHTRPSGSALIDFSNLSSESMLSVKDSEGSAGVVVLITSTGEFEQGIARFSQGNKFTSSYSSGKYIWNGKSISTYEISVKVLQGAAKSVVLYSLQYADDANGTNLKDSSLLKATADGSANIPMGAYAKLTLIRGQKAEIKDSSGNIITSDWESYFPVDMNYIIEVTPSEAISVGFKITSSNNDFSGCGHFTFDLYESKTSNGVFTLVEQIKANTCQNTTSSGTIAKNHYFYIKTTFDDRTLYEYFVDTNAAISVDGLTSTPASWNPHQSEQSPTYYSSGNYAFGISWYNDSCFTLGTKILTSKGVYVNIEKLTYQDEIMTWNFFESRYETRSIAIIVDHGEQEYKTTRLSFSDGSELSVIGDHGLFDYGLNSFVYISTENCGDYIGHKFAKYDKGKTRQVTLVDAKTSSMLTHAYSLVSSYNYNAITNGLLTLSPPGGFFNWMPMAGEMRYDTEAFSADVSKYGLYDYSAFEPYGISYEAFTKFNCKYLKIPVAKGLFSFEYIISLFNTYKGWLQR